MSEKKMTPKDSVKDDDSVLQSDNNKEDFENQDIDRVNEARARDYEEADEVNQYENEMGYDGELEQDVEDIESGLEWLETSSSVIGGGVPVIEGASLESAISEVVESEFAYEELSAQGSENIVRNEEQAQSFFDNSINDISGPEFKPKGVKK